MDFLSCSLIFCKGDHDHLEGWVGEKISNSKTLEVSKGNGDWNKALSFGPFSLCTPLVLSSNNSTAECFSEWHLSFRTSPIQ